MKLVGTILYWVLVAVCVVFLLAFVAAVLGV